MSDRFPLTTFDEKVLSNAIRFADANRPYLIFGKIMRCAAERMKSHGYVTIAPAPAKTQGSRLSYVNVCPTATGRDLWRNHLVEPARALRGGDHRTIPEQAICEMETALLRAGTVSGAAAVLGVGESTIRYRMMKLSASGRLAGLGLKLPEPRHRGGSIRTI